jgi:hypothetical protein
MSKIFYILLIALFAFILNVSIKSKSKCMALGDDCDLTQYCCGNYVCKDYRCAVKGTKENQVKWAKKGGKKCDWWYHCKKNMKCESHRCVIDTSKLIKKTAKSISGDF